MPYKEILADFFKMKCSTDLVFGRIGAAQRKAIIQIAARAMQDTTDLNRNIYNTDSKYFYIIFC